MSFEVSQLFSMLSSALPHILAGGIVGILIGLTGVGGGSIMTPILIGFGYNPAVAIGTDLFYAAITKAGGVVFHQRAKHIHWDIVGAMAAGSLPAAILTAFTLKFFFSNDAESSNILTTSLGVMLILTATVLLFKNYLTFTVRVPWLDRVVQENRLVWTCVLGIPLGALVTLSSVGAGALGTALLLAIYPKLSGTHVVGTDLAHAVPLTFVAGLSHYLVLGNLDFALLFGLLVGSLPGIAVGTRLSKKVPNEVMLPILAVCLIIIGVKYAFF